VGNFPPGWNEWNDKYRDTLRGYWKGDGGLIGECARRISGSADLYEASGRKPHASINFITAHDGFTLEDLVSYNDKHNEANGEGNRDGHNENRSWNCGVEGASDDAAVLALRRRQKRNLLASLLLSQGVPMILGGDEISRTQRGNNNAYCQDNEISWSDWNLDERRGDFLAFVRRVVRLRREHPVFSRRRYVRADTLTPEGLKEIIWLNPDGREMTPSDWHQDFARCFGVYLAGAAIERRGRRGEPIRDSSFLLLLNAHHEAIAFRVAEILVGKPWMAVLDTALDDPFQARPLPANGEYPLLARSLALLEEVEAPSSSSAASASAASPDR
jgi:glycogen operon protein